MAKLYIVCCHSCLESVFLSSTAPLMLVISNKIVGNCGFLNRQNTNKFYMKFGSYRTIKVAGCLTQYKKAIQSSQDKICYNRLILNKLETFCGRSIWIYKYIFAK